MRCRVCRRRESRRELGTSRGIAAAGFVGGVRTSQKSEAVRFLSDSCPKTPASAAVWTRLRWALWNETAQIVQLRMESASLNTASMTVPTTAESHADGIVPTETIHAPTVLPSCDRVCIDFRWLLYPWALLIPVASRHPRPARFQRQTVRTGYRAMYRSNDSRCYALLARLPICLSLKSNCSRLDYAV